MRDRHRQNARQSRAFRRGAPFPLKGQRLAEPLKAVKDLIVLRGHPHLNGVVVPVDLGLAQRLGESRLESVAQGEILQGFGSRGKGQQDVGGEENLPVNLQNGRRIGLRDGDGSPFSQRFDGFLSSFPQARGLRENIDQSCSAASAPSSRFSGWDTQAATSSIRAAKSGSRRERASSSR